MRTNDESEIKDVAASLPAGAGEAGDEAKEGRLIEDRMMSNATYQIIRRGHEWALRVGGVISGIYETKAAAIEAATAAARIALRRGCEVSIQVEGERGKLRLRGVAAPLPE
jgi:Uncharacterized protein conserved in bacteria (DUF2188)